MVLRMLFICLCWSLQCIDEDCSCVYAYIQDYPSLTVILNLFVFLVTPEMKCSGQWLEIDT